MDFDRLYALKPPTPEEFDRIKEGILALAPKGKPEVEESLTPPFSREKQIEWQEKRRAEAEESLADLLTTILNRLDILESHFTPAGLDILSETLERRLVARLRRQGSVNFPAIKYINSIIISPNVASYEESHL